MIKPSKKAFTFMLLGLVVILVIFGLARMKFGAFLPAVIDKNLPDAVIVCAIAIMLWNRQILAQEKKEAEERKKAEEDAAKAAAEAESEAEGEGGAEASAQSSGEARGGEGDARS